MLIHSTEKFLCLPDFTVQTAASVLSLSRRRQAGSGKVALMLISCEVLLATLLQKGTFVLDQKARPVAHKTTWMAKYSSKENLHMRNASEGAMERQSSSHVKVYKLPSGNPACSVLCHSSICEQFQKHSLGPGPNTFIHFSQMKC